MHRSFRRRVAFAVLAGVLLAPAVVHADAGVTVALTAQKVTESNGHELLVAAEKAKPGEVLEYRAVYRNGGTRDVRDLVATLPLPQGVELLAKTANPPATLASLDGRTFAPVPLTRTERTADGRTVTRDVPLAEYRALRWSIGTLGAKQSCIVAARVRIAPVAVGVVAH